MTNKHESIDFFEKMKWFAEGEYTPEGLVALAELLDPLPTVWGKTPKGNAGRWGPVFDKLMCKIVPFSTELVVVENGKVLLTWREFEGTAGWHTPGSYVNPRESWQDTVSRIAKREIGADVTFECPLYTFNNHENPRFHDLTVLAQCRLTSTPEKGQHDPSTGTPTQGEYAWFSEKPDNILPVHDKYWDPIEAALHNS